MLSDSSIEQEYKEAFSLYVQEKFDEALPKFERCFASQASDDLKRKIALSNFELGKFDIAKNLYLELTDMPQASFATLFDKKIDEAENMYHLCPYSPASKWGTFLCQLLKDNRSIFNPGYLCFRLFLESTLTYLIRFKIEDYLMVLEDAAYDIQDVFPEYVKSIGSAYLSNKKYYLAIDNFEEAKRYCHYDAEVYYKLAQAYMLVGDTKVAKANFNKTLEYLPGHIASLRYLDKINSSD